MHDYLVAALLGIVEGLTEFLPVSSTAHLRLSEALLHISLGDGYWKMFAVVIQLGAVLCLPVYFAPRIARFVATYPSGERGDRNALTHPFGLTIVAFVITAVPAFLLTKVIGRQLENVYVMGASLLVGGVVMWIVDARNAAAERLGPSGAPSRVRTWTMDAMSMRQAVWIGACQILSAVFPGTSRSMATIAAGQLAGMSRAAALEFSFFLSMPTMGAATLYTLQKSIHGTPDNPIGVAQIDAHGWAVLAVGLVVSFVVAYASVAWFMAYVRKHGFVPFAIYRLLLGAVVLAAAARL
jgi:undecaprenyl-diphosphatase